MFLLVLLFFTAAQSVAPRRWRHSLACFLDAHPATLRALYLVSVAAFISFGAARTLLLFASAWHRLLPL